MFNINCEVWGGVTGHRSSVYKDCGKVVEFETLKEAEAEAERLTRDMNGGYASASFRYTAIPA